MTMNDPQPSFDHESARQLKRQHWEAGSGAQEVPSWRKPRDSFTDITLQRIMDRLDEIERSLARLERNARP
jgi:hypothetical protein